MENQVGEGLRRSGNLGGRRVKREWKSRWEGGYEGVKIQVGGVDAGLKVLLQGSILQDLQGQSHRENRPFCRVSQELPRANFAEK